MRDPYSAERGIWHKAKQRVTDETAANYRYYGGRGITMCERWLTSFDVFLSDMGARPSKDYSLERRNNDGNYEPSNCYWATRLTQANNKRNNVFLEFQGRRMSVAEWTKLRGMQISTLYRRLGLGWSVEKALTEPIERDPVYTYLGATRNLSEWARTTGIRRSTLNKRLRLGWPIERALTEAPNPRFRRRPE